MSCIVTSVRHPSPLCTVTFVWLSYVKPAWGNISPMKRSHTKWCPMKNGGPLLSVQSIPPEYASFTVNYVIFQSVHCVFPLVNMNNTQKLKFRKRLKPRKNKFKKIRKIFKTPLSLSLKNLHQIYKCGKMTRRSAT